MQLNRRQVRKTRLAGLTQRKAKSAQVASFPLEPTKLAGTFLNTHCILQNDEIACMATRAVNEKSSCKQAKAKPKVE